MSQVSVRVIEGGRTSSLSALENLSRISESIRNRAYDLSQQRGNTSGNEMNDWLQAERDLFTLPQSELSESSREYTIQVSMPGLDASNIEVSSVDNSIIVTASNGTASSQRNNTGSSAIRFSEMGSKSIFRRIDLPSSITSSKVTASLENGMLTITAPKSAALGRSSAAGA